MSLEGLRKALTKNRETPAQVGERVLGDLLDVGEQKPLGCLPLTTITRYGSSPEKIAEDARDQGKYVKTFGRGESAGTPSMYIADPEALEGVLSKNAATLEAAGWPTEPKAFVDRVATEAAPGKTALFDVIADTFSDHQNRGRTDV